VFARPGDDFVVVPPGTDGWTLIVPIDVELRAESSASGSVLHLQLRGQPETDRIV
jgi:hypothetical protein